MTFSRRRLLASGASFAGAVLAGCVGGSGDGTRNNSTSPGSVPVPDDSPVADVEVTATDVVVSLEPDNRVSRLNLIAPDGTAFARRTVTAGATTVRIPIIETSRTSFWEGYYRPGVHELVVIAGEDRNQLPIPIEPAVRVRSVEPAYSDTGSTTTGHIEVTLENVGSGPTWVYNIAYEGSPHATANYSLPDDRTWPQLDSPTDVEEIILRAGESKTYVGDIRPLRFEDFEGETCPSDPIEFRMMIGLGHYDPLSVDLRVTPSGALIHRRGRALCTDVNIEFESDEGSTWD